MHVISRALVCLVFANSLANAQITPQTVRPSDTMDDPGVNWFMAVTRDAGYIYDGTTGEMQGLITLSDETPAVQPGFARKEFYNAASFHSRGAYGDRTDLVVIHDFANLSPVAEVEIPAKTAYLSFRNYIGLLSEGNHVVVSNLTPAQSVSIVDVANRNFVGEISTPGCSLILPVQDNDFLTICGDGTLMLVDVDSSGREAGRTRSSQFFDLQEDPVYDWATQTNDGWLLFTHGGKAMEVTTRNGAIQIGDAWDLLTEEEREETWWPGGRQLATLHRGLGLFYIAMHQGERYTHHEPGTEVWVYSLSARRKIATIEFEVPVGTIMVTQEAEPLLVVGDEERGTHVYDALTFKLQHTLEGPPAELFEDL